MYGGVATPLALLHQMQQGGASEVNGRSKPQRSSSRDEGGANSGGGTSSHSHHGGFSSGMHPSLLMRNTSRLPPLRENNSRENGGNGGNRHGECEPLLPLSGNVMKILPTQQQRSNYINNSSGGGGGGGCGGSSNSGGGSGSKKLHQQRSVGGGDLDNLANLPPPPLPPHKSGHQFTNFQGHPSASSKSVSRPQDVTRYTPPWPRGGGGLSEVGNNRGSSGSHTNTNNINIVSSSHHQNSTGNDMNSGAVKPYMKPLPKLPGKESASPSHGRHHRSQTRGHNSSAPPLPPHQQPLLPPLPMRPSEHYYSRAEEASIRTKLRNSHNNPLLHLQRHYSDESLPGATGFYFSSPAQQRIHSSADEISSLNHSPSISSSDESYSRTTDADASPSPSPPHATAGDRASTQQWLYPSDIQVDPSSSLENSPRASLDYIPPHCYLPGGGGGNHNNNASGVGQSGGGKISNVTPSQDLPPPNLTTSRSFSPSNHQPNSRGNRSNVSSAPGVGIGNNALATTRHDWNLSPARHRTGDVSAEHSSTTNSRSRSTKSTVATNTETLPPATLLALAAASNTMDSKCCSPLPHSLDGQDSYRGDSCGSFEYIGHRNALKQAEKPSGIHRASSANGESCHSTGSGRSPSRSLKHLHNQDRRQGGASGSTKTLPCESAVVSPDDNIGSKNGGTVKQPSGDDGLGERDHPSACGGDVEEENSRATSTSERSSKKDGSSQTDRKDLSKSHRRRNSSASGAGGIGTKTDSHAPLLSSINTRSLGADGMGSALAGKLPSPLTETGSKYHYQGAAAVVAKIPDFEREIQRLLEDQNLLKNIPPKCEKTHQNKEIISLEELKNVNQVLTELGHSSYLLEKDPVVGMLGRYVLSKSDHMVNNNNNSNCPTPQPPQQVGLAAIQELARRQQDELNNIVDATDRNHTGFCFNSILENKIALSQQQVPSTTCMQQHCDRESSRESSLKRGRNGTPSSPTVEHSGAKQEFKALKVRRTSAVSPMDTISGGGNVVACANSPPLCATTKNRGSCQGVHRFPSSRYALSG